MYSVNGIVKKEGYWKYKCGSYNSNPKKISKKGLKFIEKVEGLSNTAYRGIDVENLTIGIGHVIQPGENLTELTDDEARKLLKKDLNKKSTYNKRLQEYLKNVVKLHVKQYQYDALISLAFNAGAWIWEKSPHFTTLLREGVLDTDEKKKEIIKEFATYSYSGGKKVKGLWRRHVNEGLLFTTGKYKNYGFKKLKKLGWSYTED